MKWLLLLLLISCARAPEEPFHFLDLYDCYGKVQTNVQCVSYLEITNGTNIVSVWEMRTDIFTPFVGHEYLYFTNWTTNNI